MTYVSDAAVQHVQNLSWQVGGCRTESEIELVVTHWLFDHIPCAEACFTDYPAKNGPTKVRVVPDDSVYQDVEERVLQHFAEDPETDHPLLRHYFQQWRPATPLRMSDLVSDRQLRSTRIYSQVFQPYGITRQLGIISRRVSSTDNAGYALMRHGSEFRDEDVAVATLAQPVLAAVHAAVRGTGVDIDAGAADRARLTAAEGDVLRLLASGLTAVAIGHARGCSPLTVRKHLESIYLKLGVRDRLSAVTQARRTGLLPRD